MSRAAYCQTPNCTEHDTPKPMPDSLTLLPGEQVSCGECLQPCEIREVDTEE